MKHNGDIRIETIDKNSDKSGPVYHSLATQSTYNSGNNVLSNNNAKNLTLNNIINNNNINNNHVLIPNQAAHSSAAIEPKTEQILHENFENNNHINNTNYLDSQRHNSTPIDLIHGTRNRSSINAHLVHLYRRVNLK